MRRFALTLLLATNLCVFACDDGGSGDAADTQDTAASTDSVATDSGVATDTATTSDSTVEDTDVVDDTTVDDDTTASATDTAEAPADVTDDTSVDTTTEEDTTSASNGACDNAVDLNKLATATDLPQTVQDCALSALTSAAAAGQCVQDAVGLSAECSVCFGDILKCAIDNCALQCIGGATPACNDCRALSCDGPFEACAGISAQL
ncbi:MAG: hypothetical protein ACI9MR_000481 [Myxococcota bacterium]|jgi:hypothetical protein